MKEKFYLHVPYAEKVQAKTLGASWDHEQKLWYVLDPQSIALQKWPLPPPSPNNDTDTTLPGEDRTFGNPSLFVDLIPRTCWFTNVRSAVIPEDWDRLRHLVYQRANNQCEICDAKGRIEAHERWDYNQKTHTQTLTRLIALCQNCHTATHFGLAQVRGVDAQALLHLQKVNHWNKSQAEQHVDEAFAIWDYRNKYHWTLDLTILTSAGYHVRIPETLQRQIIADETLKTTRPSPNV
jgi:hypothetical protein